MGDLELSLVLKADGSGLVGTMRVSKAEMEKLGKETENTNKKMGKFSRGMDTTARLAKRLNNNSKNLSRSLFSLKTLFAGLGIGLVSRSFVQAASTSEQYRVRLKVLLGSVEEGNRLFKEMSDYAGEVPFKYESIMASATQLSGVMRGGVDEIKQWMPLIGDLAATSGLSIEQTTEQVIRMYSSGAASADMFRERGILAMLGFQAGVSVSAEETRKRLMDEWTKTGSQFRGATNELAKTWSGAMSMLDDKWFQFRNQVMDAGLFDYMKSFVNLIDDDLGDALDGSQQSAKIWSDNIIDAIEYVVVGTASISDQLAAPASELKDIAADLWEGYTELPGWAQEVGILGALLGGTKGKFLLIGAAKFMADSRTTGEWWSAYSEGHIGFTEWFTSGHDESLAKLNELKNSGIVLGDELPNIPDKLFGDGDGSGDTASAAAKARAFFAKVRAGMNDTAGAGNNLADKTNVAAGAARELSKEQQSLLDTIYPADKAFNDYSDSLNELLKIKQALMWTDEQYQDAVDQLTNSYLGLDDATEKVAESADNVAQIYEDTATSIRGAFRGAFRDLLDGTNSLFDRMKNLFKDMLADMATMAIARPVIIPMVTGLGGMLGVSGAAQASVANQLGGAGGFSYAGFSGQQGSMLADQTAEFGTDGAVMTAQAAGGSGFMEAAGGVLGAGFMGYMAGGVAAEMFNVANPKMAANLTAVGAMIAGPIGGVVGFAVGSLFSGSWQTKNSGLELSLAGGDFSGRAFSDQEKKGGLFSSDSSRTLYSGLDAELSENLRKTFNTITDDFSDMGDTLGRDADSVLASFTTSARLSLQGLSESEISEAIDGWIQDVANQMALEILPGLRTFQRAGEEASATLSRLTNTLEGIRDLDKSIADDIFVLTAGSLDDLVLAVGADIASINGLSIASFGANLTQELAAQYVVLSNANAVIADTMSAIANTADITERVSLEQQLSDQVMERYLLEQEMLTSMGDSVRAVIADISGMRSGISDDIQSITGAANYRDIAAIRGDVNAITPANAPIYTPIDLRSIDVRVNNALQTVINAQNIKSVFEGQLQNVMSDQVLADYVSGLDAAGRSIQDQIDIFNNLGSTFTFGPIYDGLNAIVSLEGEIAASQADVATKQQAHETLLADQLALEQAAAAALIAYNAVRDDYVDLTSDQVSQLQNLREETLRYYNAQKQLDTAMTGAADNIGATLERLRLSELAPGARLDDQLASFRGLYATAENLTGYDLVGITQQLNSLVDPLLSQARDLYASGDGYQLLFNEITQALADMQDRLITEAPIDYEQGSLDLLNSIDGLLATMQGELTAAERAIVDAIDLSRIDTVATLQDIRGLLGGEERTIDGTHAGGLARVPFDGYIAETHIDEGIIDATTMSGLRRYGIPVNNTGSANTSKLLPVLERIAKATEQSGGDFYFKMVTPDGKVLKEETLRDLKKRSKYESVVHENGVYS